MNICNGDKYRDGNHDEVVFDGDCPVCGCLQKIHELEKTIDDLKTELEEAQNEAYR